MNDTDLRTRCGRALDELGLTADDVADTLRAREIRGDRASWLHCPIAEVLLAVDGVTYVEVLDSAAYLNEPTDVENPTIVDLPDPVGSFVFQFDRGVYLDLIATPAVTR